MCSVCERERENERGNKGRAGFEHEGTKSEKAGEGEREIVMREAMRSADG